VIEKQARIESGNIENKRNLLREENKKHGKELKGEKKRLR
jgi:hypothetical protein